MHSCIHPIVPLACFSCACRPVPHGPLARACSLSGLVHGDLRSHVILSPPTTVAGSNHVCESILIAINTSFEDHGDLPRLASVQLDNAPVNHSMLVFGFAAPYVLFGIFDKFRVRFELVLRPAGLVHAIFVRSLLPYFSDMCSFVVRCFRRPLW